MASYPFNSQRPTSSVFEAPETLVIDLDSDGNTIVRPLENVSLCRNDFTLTSLLLAGIDPSTISFSSSSGSRFDKYQQIDSLDVDSLFSNDQ